MPTWVVQKVRFSGENLTGEKLKLCFREDREAETNEENMKLEGRVRAT